MDLPFVEMGKSTCPCLEHEILACVIDTTSRDSPIVHIGMIIQDSVRDIAIKRETYQTYFWMKDAYLLIFHDNSAMANEKNPGNQSLHRFKDDPSVRESSEILTRVESIQISDPSPIHLIGIHRHSKLVFLK